jgi:hypothetical protein
MSVRAVGSDEASTDLFKLLEHAHAGEQGKKDTRQVIAQLKAFGRGRKLPVGVTVRDLIAERRRG